LPNGEQSNHQFPRVIVEGAAELGDQKTPEGM
jgi:hypothetical protein